MSTKNKEISRLIQQSVESQNPKEKRKNSINWPYTENKALSEFGDEINLFCKAFPWLFPGGIGDFSQIPNQTEIFEQCGLSECFGMKMDAFLRTKFGVFMH